MNLFNSSHKISPFSRMLKLEFDGRSFESNGPAVMGIINLTPDSFYEGSRKTNIDEALRAAESMLEQGANILDLGAVSTRPGADIPDEVTETARLIPAITAIMKRFPEAYLSVDTFRHDLAKKAAEHGAFMINDISGGTFDRQMIETIGRLNIPYVLMHTTDLPQKMQQNAINSQAPAIVRKFFHEQCELFRKAGAKQLIFDPGFGFGKTLEANYALLNHLSDLAPTTYPILVGVSRKSMIYKVLQVSASEALNGTSVLNTVGLLNGASILRVHDVKEARETIRLLRVLHENEQK